MKAVKLLYMATYPGNRLKKVLGIAFGIAVVVGGTIGVGILRAPASIAAILPDVPLVLVCWLVIGIYILLAASSYAELTTMIPRAGGAYNYIRRALGDYAGFLNGWFDFICNAIAPAYFCIVLSEYSALLLPPLKTYSTLIAISFLTVFTLLNLPGVKSGSAVQQLTSTVKVILFLALVTGCFLKTPARNTISFHNDLLKGSIVIAVFKSLQLIIGSYDGWMAVSFFAEEDDNPEKNIPKSYLLGALTVTILYLLINAAIFYVLPITKVAASPLAASDAAAVAFGKWSTPLITIIALFSLFSILNAYMMIPPRILFGLSRDRFFIKQGAAVNKGGTPYFSLLFCYLLSTALIITSSFDQLFAFGAVLTTIVTGFSFFSLLRLRKKEPLLKRPYRAWGYPYSTIFALLVSAALFVGFAISDKISLLIVCIVTACSFPCYRLFVNNKKKKSTNVVLVP